MAQRPQNKHLKPEAGQAALGIVPLTKGEASGTVRIRCQEEALSWFASLTASQRGYLVQVAHARARPADEQPTPLQGG